MCCIYLYYTHGCVDVMLRVERKNRRKTASARVRCMGGFRPSRVRITAGTKRTWHEKRKRKNACEMKNWINDNKKMFDGGKSSNLHIKSYEIILFRSFHPFRCRVSIFFSLGVLFFFFSFIGCVTDVTLVCFLISLRGTLWTIRTTAHHIYCTYGGWARRFSVCVSAIAGGMERTRARILAFCTIWMLFVACGCD